MNKKKHHNAELTTLRPRNEVPWTEMTAIKPSPFSTYKVIYYYNNWCMVTGARPHVCGVIVLTPTDDLCCVWFIYPI
jgi:hypothetical protein